MNILKNLNCIMPHKKINFNKRHFKKVKQIGGHHLYGVQLNILFTTKRTCQAFLKLLKKDKFLCWPSRKANLLNITIVGTDFETAKERAIKVHNLVKTNPAIIEYHFCHIID